jgi:hypothetical protein
MPFVALVAYAMFGSPFSGDPAAFALVVSPLLIATGNYAYPRIIDGMRQSQRDAVAMARKVGVGA